MLFNFIFFVHHAYSDIHILAVGNHPEIEKEKKDMWNRTRQRSNPQCFEWKSTAQTTALYSHSPTHPRTHTHTHTHTHAQAHTHARTHARHLPDKSNKYTVFSYD